MLVIVTSEIEKIIKINGKKVKTKQEAFSRFETKSSEQVDKIVSREKKKKNVKKITVGPTVVYRRSE